jgi:hypothetical protein
MMKEGRKVCLTGGKATGCSHEEGAALVEVGRTAEVGAMTEEGVLVDEPKRISGESGEYRRRTWTTYQPQLK